MQTFSTLNAFGIVTIGSIYTYRKVWINDAAGNRVRNPAFDRISGYLLDLKDATNRNFDFAVVTCGGDLLRELKQPNILGAEEQAIICIVPSSKEDKVSPGLLKIAKMLERDDGRLKEASKTLVRTSTIDKLANGGNRGITVHRASIGIGEKVRTDRTYIVLDDITTTGNSMAACVELLQQKGARRILPIALGKTE